MRKLLGLLCLAALLLLCACQPSAPEATSGTPTPAESAAVITPQAENTPEPAIAPDGREIRTFTDLSGKQVSHAYPIERIVSLQPNTTEILYAIGAGGLIAGTDVWSNYPEEAKTTPKMGDYANPNLELIIAAKPDLVVTGGALSPENFEKLASLGIPVASIEAQNYGDISTSIELLGGCLGGEYLANAAALVNDILLRTDAVKEATQNYTHRPTVYFVLSYGEMGNWTSGPDSFINEMIEMAGGTPVTNDAGDRWLEYDLETLVKKDPDILLVTSDIAEQGGLVTSPGYRDLSAVKNGRICVMDAGILSRPGPRFIEALEAFAEAIKPFVKQ